MKMKKLKNMKRYNLQSIGFMGLLAVLTMSCENQEMEFPDSGKSTVYFAYQYPVRTIVLGEDIYDTSLDNEHRCQIYATMGGVYENKKKIDIGIAVDNGLCNNLFFDEDHTAPVQAMPANFYTLAGNQISLDRQMQGAVGVQLSDAFFADPNAIQNTYAIPLRMVDVSNADAILSGVPKVDEPNRVDATHWDVQPKDYVLYFVKFINPWHSNYLRRGTDQVTVNGVTSTVSRHKPTVEGDEVRKLTTLSLDGLNFPQDYKTYSGLNLNMSVRVNFDENQTCTVTPVTTSYQLNDSIRVYNIAADGNGAFKKRGEKKSWGNQDRDALYLQYNVSYEVETKYPNAGFPDRLDQVSYITSDTLVVRDRGVKLEVLTPFYND
jgi:hypothetical protein